MSLDSVPVFPSPVIPPVQATVILPKCLPETQEYGKLGRESEREGQKEESGKKLKSKGTMLVPGQHKVNN